MSQFDRAVGMIAQIIAARQIIRTPTLVLHGANDPLVPVEGGIDTAAHISGAELKIIPGMVHDLPAEITPILVQEIIRHCRAADIHEGSRQ